ncbi:BPI fold-containing family A member 2 isoform X2 [Vombatus ursinus]|uniref:BPI fold-containing family A member 2 isoform X2 n=1 Tax=Vombatus ursinus TaxID=29139 RepID=UPI000FFDB938|nr:BPI fold-containing family A member 2 isoform X2 [Vombatus ursinus]
MLSLWRLTLLCGLFIGPSCCQLDSLSPLLGDLKSVLNKETQLVTDKLPVIDQELTDELEKLKLSPIGKILEPFLENVGNSIGTTVNTVVSKLEKILGLKVQDLTLLKTTVELGSDGKSINLKIPVSATVALKINPFLSDIKLKVGLDILVHFSLGTDAKTGISVVLFGECSSDSATVSLSLLDGFSGLQKFLLRGLDDLLEKLVPVTLEKQICPLIKSRVQLLDVSVVQNLISSCSIVFDEFPYNLVHG